MQHQIPLRFLFFIPLKNILLRIGVKKLVSKMYVNSLGYLETPKRDIFIQKESIKIFLLFLKICPIRQKLHMLRKFSIFFLTSFLHETNQKMFLLPSSKCAMCTERCHYFCVFSALYFFASFWQQKQNKKLQKVGNFANCENFTFFFFSSTN